MLTVNGFDINALLGRISFDVLKELSDAVVNSNPQSAIEVLEKIYNSGNEPTQILQNLLDYFKNMLIVKNCKPEIVFEVVGVLFLKVPRCACCFWMIGSAYDQ